MLDPGESVEFNVDLRGLDPLLSASKEFTLQLTPGQGNTLIIKSTTPSKLAEFVELP